MAEKYKRNISSCSYCGDAHVSHAFLFVTSAVSSFTDPMLSWLGRHTPKFFNTVAEYILSLLLKIAVLLRLARFSKDIEKSASLRSRVIWEEALRRGLIPEQLIILGKPSEHFRVKINGRYHYYDSLPIPPWYSDSLNIEWDNKFLLKKRFTGTGVPTPRFQRVPAFKNNLQNIFDSLTKPIIVKPALGSRGRHTTTNISDFEKFQKAIKIGRKISPSLVVEEHLDGYVCRATLVGGKLAGFYRAEPPAVIGDGVKTLRELIKEKDANRPDRVSEVVETQEMRENVARQGYTFEDVIPNGKKVALTHRTGRLFGGKTREMKNELHPSFVPILELAASITQLPIMGFDCIVPDPEAPQDSQFWGIIECNTLPFIDLHYYALEGKPGNIAGMVWDLWNK